MTHMTHFSMDPWNTVSVVLRRRCAQVCAREAPIWGNASCASCASWPRDQPRSFIATLFRGKQLRNKSYIFEETLRFRNSESHLKLLMIAGEVCGVSHLNSKSQIVSLNFHGCLLVSADDLPTILVKAVSGRFDSSHCSTPSRPPSAEPHASSPTSLTGGCPWPSVTIPTPGGAWVPPGPIRQCGDCVPRFVTSQKSKSDLIKSQGPDMPRKGSPSRLRFPANGAFDEVLSKSAFARFLKCDPSRITQMVKAGTIRPPALTDTGEIVAATALEQMQAAGCFASPAAATGTTPPAAPPVIPGETYDQARTRLASSQADAQEMTNAVRRGELVEVAKVCGELEGELSRVRTRLMAIPAEQAAALARVSSPLSMQEALRDLMIDVLTELSDPAAYGKGR